MIGICTWQHAYSEIPPDPRWPYPLPKEYRTPDGCDGPLCRYFVSGTVIANDREAGILAVRMDDTGRIDVCHFGDFNGGEVVAYDKTLPKTAKDAHRRALKGEVF